MARRKLLRGAHQKVRTPLEPRSTTICINTKTDERGRLKTCDVECQSAKRSVHHIIPSLGVTSPSSRLSFDSELQSRHYRLTISKPISMAAPPPDEKTFRTYTTSDAEKYAQHRQEYSEALYQSIYTYHTSTGGKLDTVVDLGCGRKQPLLHSPRPPKFSCALLLVCPNNKHPDSNTRPHPQAGIATFKLAETFGTTIGLDPSEGMISAARSLATEKAPSGGSGVRFEVSTAEDISADLIPDGSVDLITAATCAHVSLCSPRGALKGHFWADPTTTLCRHGEQQVSNSPGP